MMKRQPHAQIYAILYFERKKNEKEEKNINFKNGRKK